MGDEAPDWGTPEAAVPEQEPLPPDLLTLPEFVLRENSGGFLSNGYYELLSTEEFPLGVLYKESGSGNWLFGSSRRTYVLADTQRRVIARIHRDSSWGRARFEVTAADDRPIGTLEQSNTFGAPRLILRAMDGAAAQLTGGGFGSGGLRTLSDPADRPVGDVTKRFGWGAFFSGTDIYLVRIGAVITGDLRVLSIVATACIDLILNDQQKNRNNNPGISFG